ncbi:MAG TPA: hypothetical protein VN642_08615 [Dongiaceae bacterium]|nr:hypothetical protein [Dongiaceae bacterium]
MSSILRALRKLEDDKALLRPDELKIDSEILRADKSHRFSPAGMILTSLLLLASGSGATYMYMKHGRSPGVESAKTPPATGQPRRPFSAANIETERLPEAVVVVPANQQKNFKVEKSGKRQPPMPAETAHTGTGSRPAKPAEQANISVAPSPAPSPAPTRTVPHLRVNGIAFQDGVDSVAMINGVPVSSGSVIDGAKIEEIYKDKVRFSYNGEIFEINLGQSNR